MGQNFSSEPVVDKETERQHNDTFNVAVSSCQGWRMTQEDNHSLILDLQGNHKAAFFAVYDGHGSAKVSKHASENLWRHLVENEMYIKGEFKEALEQSFLNFDREVNQSYNALLAGTTAVCLLVVDNIIYCANIGDSRGVACVNCECIPLSYDHKPENPNELKRIIAAGGYVLGNRVNGNLALSRAFGDFHYKSNDQLPPEQQIVSPCPDVKRIELNDDLDFLVLACDGIWDVLSNEEVVEFVIARLEQNMEPGLICEQLTTRCLATDYDLIVGCDNMTVLLVCYTRGRCWVDYCTDIFNKNTRKLGVNTRERPTLMPEDGATSALLRETTDKLVSDSDENTEQRDKELYDILSRNDNESSSEDDQNDQNKAESEAVDDSGDKKDVKAELAESESTQCEADPSSNNQNELVEQTTCVVELGSPDDEEESNEISPDLAPDAEQRAEAEAGTDAKVESDDGKADDDNSVDASTSAEEDKE